MTGLITTGTCNRSRDLIVADASYDGPRITALAAEGTRVIKGMNE